MHMHMYMYVPGSRGASPPPMVWSERGGDWGGCLLQLFAGKKAKIGLMSVNIPVLPALKRKNRTRIGPIVGITSTKVQKKVSFSYKSRNYQRRNAK